MWGGGAHAAKEGGGRAARDFPRTAVSGGDAQSAVVAGEKQTLAEHGSGSQAPALRTGRHAKHALKVKRVGHPREDKASAA